MPSLDITIGARDPILLRDGRPFNAEPGAMAMTLPWPLPSTLAGAVRTCIGDSNNWDWAQNGPRKACAVRVRGPVMAVRGDSGWKVYVKAPADAVPYRENPAVGESIRFMVLQPEQKTAGGCLWPEGLLPLRVSNDCKPDGRLVWWPLDAALGYLKEGVAPQPADCLPALPKEGRVHVRMNAGTLTADPGGLFATESLCLPDLTIRNKPDNTIYQETAILARVDCPDGLKAPTGFSPLGGERRVARFGLEAGLCWPTAPAEWLKELAAKITRDKRLKLQFVTPAVFDGGWLPGWLQGLAGVIPGTNVRVKLISAAIPRRMGFSGWDYAYVDSKTQRRGQPKKARFAVPDGSVFFLEVQSKAVNAECLSKLWLGGACDCSRDNNDGFGLVLPGVWDYAK